MKLQRRFAPTRGEFTPESVARFIGIRNFLLQENIVRRGDHIKPHYRDKNCH